MMELVQPPSIRGGFFIGPIFGQFGLELLGAINQPSHLRLEPEDFVLKSNLGRYHSGAVLLDGERLGLKVGKAAQ